MRTSIGSHPAVLRLIRMTLEAAEKRGIPVSMCGEMASNLHYIQLLLGMGLRHFSMNTGDMRGVKKMIRSTTVAEAQQLAGKILQMTQASQVDQFLHAWMMSIFRTLTNSAGRHGLQRMITLQRRRHPVTVEAKILSSASKSLIGMLSPGCFWQPSGQLLAGPLLDASEDC